MRVLDLKHPSLTNGAVPSASLKVVHESPIKMAVEDMQRLRSVVETHAGGIQDHAAEMLETELDRAHVLPGSELRPEVVRMRSRVLYEDVDTGERREVVLEYPEQADISHSLDLSARPDRNGASRSFSRRVHLLAGPRRPHPDDPGAVRRPSTRRAERRVRAFSASVPAVPGMGRAGVLGIVPGQRSTVLDGNDHDLSGARGKWTGRRCQRCPSRKVDRSAGPLVGTAARGVDE